MPPEFPGTMAAADKPSSATSDLSLRKEDGSSAKMRIRWEFDDEPRTLPRDFAPIATQDEAAIARDLESIRNIIQGDQLTTLFQPIFDAVAGSVAGYEALTRTRGQNPFGNIGALFQRAIQTGCVCALDCACLERSLHAAGIFSLQNRSECLFLNLCPETLMNNGLFLDTCDVILQRLSIPREKIVLEITEESMISNYSFFRKSLEIYRRKGYRIAIDDFGAGYGGLKMLSTIEPDFVKIDRHFIADIDRAAIKYNLVDAVATACHRIGISVVAEGIERKEELSVLMQSGIRYLQGFLLAHPSPYMNSALPAGVIFGKDTIPLSLDVSFIGDICANTGAITPDTQVISAMKRFIADPNLRTIPVVDGAIVVGMLHRGRFLEEQIIGRHGYAYSMNTYKTVADVMERNFFLCEANTTLDDLSRRIRSRESSLHYDDICVTRGGRYLGTVPISLLLNAITERNIILAKGSNPLTGMPGNDFIQREISLRLGRNMHFDVCYIDMDNFKPFNDHYGFERGDIVIKALSAIITQAISSHPSASFNFGGHIGGDDFIVVTPPRDSISLCEEICARFEGMLPEFHGPDDFRAGRYNARNRGGELEQFALLSLSIGIVSTDVCRIESYPQLASLATEVKKMAKMRPGFSIVRDRRKLK